MKAVMTIPNAARPQLVPEPKMTYINDVLVRIEEAFPGTATDEMPPDALDDAPEPSELPLKG